MKKLLLLLFSICVCISICACSSGKNTNNANQGGYEGNTTVISKSDVLQSAKQSVINKICNEYGVSKVSIVYGTEDIDLFAGTWDVSLKGTYRLVDEYGDIGNSRQFSYTVLVNDEGRVLSCTGTSR